MKIIQATNFHVETFFYGTILFVGVSAKLHYKTIVDGLRLLKQETRKYNR